MRNYLISSFYFIFLLYPSNGGALSAPVNSSRTEHLIKTLPSWAFQFTASLKSLGDSAWVKEQGRQAISAFSFALHYQPSLFEHRFGLLSFGPTFSFYPIFRSSLSAHPFSIASLGFQLEYQFLYFQQQILVPTLAYSLEHLWYQLKNESRSSGELFAQGPSLGLLLFLNRLDANAAHLLYSHSGILRTYLVTEMKWSRAQSPAISWKGVFYYLGIRMEY